MKFCLKPCGDIQYDYTDEFSTYYYSWGRFKMRFFFKSKNINGRDRWQYEFLGTDKDFILFLLMYGEYIVDIE